MIVKLRAACRVLALLLAPVVALLAGTASGEELSSDWVTVQSSRVRLLAGGPRDGIVAGVELQLGDGWKTYWRTPGDSGVPPFFDWAGSENIAQTTVLYPAPKRLTDKAGDSIGYKGGVIFPVRVMLADPSRPATLRLHIEYGICRDICVPAEAQLSLSIPAGRVDALPPQLRSALDSVPGQPAPGAPVLLSSKSSLSGPRPSVTFEVRFKGAPDHNDAFAEASGGVYLPLPRRVAVEGEVTRFELDLAGIDTSELQGKTITLTLVSDAGQSEAQIRAQ